jgi:penicillin-binding protein 2
MRLKFLLVIFFTVWMVLIGRIYLISIKSNERYSDLAQKNTIKSEPLVPIRGMIYDRNGVPLAVNRLGFSISLTAHLSYKDRRDILEYYIDLIVSSFDGLDREALMEEYLKSDSPYYHDFVNVVQFVPYEEMLPQFTKLSQHDHIKIAPTTLRHYPYGVVGSHVLGYVAKSNARSGIEKVIGFEGKAGIEAFYNTSLQGQLGERVYQVTAKNEEIAEISRVEPSKDQDLYLNIDIRLQELLHDLFTGVEGVAIVMDVRDGSVLAAGSFPEYDINKFVTGISSKEWKGLIEDLHHPFLNKMVNSLYPPGSVIKQTVAMAFLESPLIDEKTDFFCTGSYIFGNRNFRCWKSSGHGHTDVRKAIRESCDIYFYKGSYQVGVNDIADKLMDFGFGRKTGVDLPNEFIGIVPNKEWKLKRYGKSWFVGETFITSIGQGSFLATPMQIARNTALIASGKLSEPTFAKRISGREVDPVVNENVFSPSDKKNIDIVRNAMVDVTSTPYGTASRYLQVPILIAGKTGTAQVVGMAQEEKTRIKESEMEYYKRSHAYLTTYAPYKNPKYVVTVLVEHGGHGGSAAGPIVTEIYNKLMELGYL